MVLSRINPSVVAQGILVPQIQNVDFDKYIGAKTNLGGNAEEMLYIVTANNINSETSVGQQWAQELTRQSYSLGQIGLPYYRINAYSEYSENEKDKFEKLSNGVSLPQFLENLAKQGINQRKHQGILFGFDTSKPQGVLANASIVTMPADSNAKTTLTEYNVAELQGFLASVARGVMDASYGTLKPVILASSVRVINYLRTAIVPLLDYQNAGGGVASVGAVYEEVIGRWLNVGNVTLIADDLLKGTDKDKMVFIAPGLDNVSSLPDDVNQNLVGEYNSITYNTMYDAGEGLRKMEDPSNFDIYSTLYTYRMTPGATLRPEAVSVVETPYS